MLTVSGHRVEVAGALTLDSATAVLREGSAALKDIAASAAVLDLSKVEHVDSSALTLVFALIRQAQASGCALSVQNPPRQLLSLAAVYGVGDMLSLA